MGLAHLQISTLRRSTTDYQLWIIVIAWAVITYLVQDHAFFWDTIQLGSKQAHWFYESEGFSLLLPTVIDSGHPPLFGWYLATAWRIFGYSLATSHWLLFPFLVGISWILWAFGAQWYGGARAFVVPLVLLSLPVFLGQSILVSPDLVLLCGWLFCLRGLYRKAPWSIVIGALLAGLISLRGMQVVFATYLFQLIRSVYLHRAGGLLSQAIQLVPPYLPGGILATAFLGYHYVQTGWIGYHPGSTWAPSFERVASVTGLLYNGALLVWRLLDYGLVIAWVSACIGFFFLPQRWTWLRRDRSAELLILLGCLIVVLVPSMLLHRSLMAHRYLLPLYWVVLWWMVELWMQLRQTHFRLGTALLSIATVGLLSGNLWVYPAQIAQGWDSTLAHLPHYRLRAEVRAEVDQRHIPLDSIGTAFPEVGPLYYKELNKETRGYAPKALDTQQYILYSNVMNDFSDAELAELASEQWERLFRIERAWLFYELYRKR